MWSSPEYYITIGDYTYTHTQLKHFYSNLHKVEHFMHYYACLGGDIHEIDIRYLKLTLRRLLWNYAALKQSGYLLPELDICEKEIYRCWLLFPHGKLEQWAIFNRGVNSIKGYMEILNIYDIYPPKYLPKKSWIRWIFGRMLLREYGEYGKS